MHFIFAHKIYLSIGQASQKPLMSKEALLDKIIRLDHSTMDHDQEVRRQSSSLAPHVLHKPLNKADEERIGFMTEFCHPETSNGCKLAIILCFR